LQAAPEVATEGLKAAVALNRLASIDEKVANLAVDDNVERVLFRYGVSHALSSDGTRSKEGASERKWLIDGNLAKRLGIPLFLIV